MMNHSKFKALLLMAVVFLLGAIVGASLGTTLVSKKFASAPEPPDGQKRHRMFETFKSRLNLSPEQASKLEVILDETHKQFSELHQSVKPQFEEIRRSMRGRIREILDEGQKKEFESMCLEYDQRKAAGKPK
jgi:hypothetical protein